MIVLISQFLFSLVIVVGKMSSGQFKTIPVFHPTMEEFTSGFSNYITNIQPLCTEFGLAKIIPPPEWNPRKPGWYEPLIRRLTIPAPIYQYVSGMKGIFQQTNIVDKQMKINQFRKIADEHLESRMPATSDEEIERRFWKNIRFEPPIYGADMKGSLFPEDLYHWNVSRLSEQNLLKYLGVDVDGVNTPYLYFGMWKAMFSWHTEDMDLFSINYLHFGEPKRWYCIPEGERYRFEQLAISHFPEIEKACKHFLRHKTTMISPSIVKAASISIYTGVQREGEIMITFPGAYHCGFNHGFNCAESVNFAIESWISRGLKATICQCKKDNVTINMEYFLSNYNLAKEAEKSENNGENDETTEKNLGVPSFVLDHFETPEKKEPPITLTIPIPGAKKSIKKKRKRTTNTKSQLLGTNSSYSGNASLDDFSAQTPWIYFESLRELSEDQIPTTLVPGSLIQACTQY